MKRIFLFSYFLFISFFCFAQQKLPAKVYGGIPSANSGKIYQIQVGAYRFEENAQDAVIQLRKADLQPVTEVFRGLTRVFVNEIPASRVRSVLSIIAGAGFREVVIREDSSPKSEPYNDEPSVSVRQEGSVKLSVPENTYIPPVQESYYTPPKQENKKPPDILCKTWRIVSCPNNELVGAQFFILEDGTYYVTNANGESSSLSEWRRNHGSEFEYSHNGWEYYGKAEIMNLTDNSLELVDSGYSYDAPGNSSAGYSNHWVFSRVVDRSSEK